MENSFKGMRALIGGSSQGIGKAVAELMAERGAEVTLLARNPERLQSVCDGLACNHGQSHSFIVADFSQPSEVLSAVSAVAKDAPFQILVNNTGGPPGGPIVDADMGAFLAAFNAHLINNHQLAQVLVPGMDALGYGRIISIISTSVKAPLKGLGVSNTVRAAVGNWSKTLSMELGPKQITVNNVLPGATMTQRLSSIIANKAKQSGQPIQAVEQAMLNQIPMGRFAQAEEVAEAVCFLASPAAAYISGINIPVDGGRTPTL